MAREISIFGQSPHDSLIFGLGRQKPSFLGDPYPNRNGLIMASLGDQPPVHPIGPGGEKHLGEPSRTFSPLPTEQGRKITLPTVIIPLEGEIEKNHLARIWNMLATYVNATDYTPPISRPTVVLDLACGRFDEAPVLNMFFGGGTPIRLVGVDASQRLIEDAISNNQVSNTARTGTSLPPNFEFYCGDARNLNSIPQVPQRADVVVIRNQNIADGELTWLQIFRQGLSRLTDKGIMIVTSLAEGEHNIAMEALQGLDCEVVVNTRNQFARPLWDVGDASFDRNIAIVKRKPKGQ